jgi:sulfate transport system substrate-binding protein
MALGATATIAGCGQPTQSPKGDKAKQKESVEILNVSYDPTRELYNEFDVAFAKHWAEKTGQTVKVKRSHAGSGKQARSVIDGLAADVVTLALAFDVDAICQKAKLLPKDWQKKLPQNSAPYTSTIVFLVRKGNPKNIKDWNDLVKEGVEVITPDPKTSGGARWNYLAAWGYVLKQELHDLAAVRDPKKAGMGDVLLAWENEAYLSVKESGKDKFEIVVPSISILAEPSVAVVEKNAEKHDTTEVAEAYLKYLYSPEGQAIAAKNYYRPRDTKSVPEEYLKNFAPVELFTIDDVFGGWEKAQPEHFDDGGIYSQISKR